MMIEVLSLVEHGWQGARQCSLELEGRGVRVLHLIKGRLTRDELAMVAPKPHIRLRAVPRWQFRLWVLAGLWRRLASRRITWLLIDHPRTLRELAGWCRAFGVVPLVIQENDDGYQLFLHEQPISLDALLNRAGRA